MKYKVNKILGYYFKDSEGWWQAKAVNINNGNVYPSFLFRHHWVEFEMFQGLERKTLKQLNRYLKKRYKRVMTDYKAEIEEEYGNHCDSQKCMYCEYKDDKSCREGWVFDKLIEARQEIDRLNNDLKQAL